MRPDKIVLAALEATLDLYSATDSAINEVPVLSMLTAPPTQLEEQAVTLAGRIDGAGCLAGVHQAPNRILGIQWYGEGPRREQAAVFQGFEPRAVRIGPRTPSPPPRFTAQLPHT